MPIAEGPRPTPPPRRIPNWHPQDPQGQEDVQDAAAQFQEHGPDEPRSLLRCPICYRRLPAGIDSTDPEVVHRRHTRSLKPALEMHLDAASRYVYRGVARTDTGVVQAGMRADLPLGDKNRLAVSIWGNFDLSQDVDHSVYGGRSPNLLSQVEVAAEYSRTFGSATAVVGYLNYNHPNNRRPSTSEVYVGFGTDDLAIQAHFDIDDIHGVYITGTSRHTFRLADRWTLRTKVKASWVDRDMALMTYGIPDAGFADLVGTAAVQYDASEHTTVSFSLNGSTIYDEDLTKRMKGANLDSDILWTSLGVTWNF